MLITGSRSHAYIIQLEQGINLIWEKIESLISNKKEKYHDIIKTL